MQHDFILIDRSGSMQKQWDEAISSVNAYVEKLADDNIDTGVTVAVFDQYGGQGCSFDVIRDRITPQTFKSISPLEIEPRGGTPLSDAIGKIVALAREGNKYEKVAIIIMTDGEENASQEYSVAQAKALLDDCRKKEWAIMFLGANFQNDAQAHSYGAGSANTAYSSPRGFVNMTTTLASKRGLYAASGVGASMDFTAIEKDTLSKE